MLEANPRAAERLAGEWLHPPAVRILESLGVDLTPDSPYESGKGFVVWPDDGSQPVVLPYPYGAFGYSCEHSRFVAQLRDIAAGIQSIAYRPHTRVKRIGPQRLWVEHKGRGVESVAVKRIVGACGRSPLVNDLFGTHARPLTYSRMAGLVLEDVELPFEGYGHVILGGPGPILTYRIDPRRVRMCLDVPFALGIRGREEESLWDGYAPVIPRVMKESFRTALRHRRILWAANQDAPRGHIGNDGFVLVGDAVGHHHPLTGVGITLGFQDAMALATSPDEGAFRTRRAREARVPELLAVVLYEVFTHNVVDAIAIRRAIYRMWRADPAERGRTMNYLSGQDNRAFPFVRTFVKTVGSALRTVLAEGVRTHRWRHLAKLVGRLVSRVAWVLGTSCGLRKAEPTARFVQTIERDRLAGAPVSVIGARVGGSWDRREPRSRMALEAGVRALIREQADDGSWEGEVVWCPMLAAQYTLACYVTEMPIPAQRRKRLLRHFEVTRLPSGTWGLHELSAPHLFVTTLVYVAARVLGVAPADPLLQTAGTFIRQQRGAVAIPSWGKFWLALLNLYDWDGVNPILPELWGFPRWFPAHPSRYYCHTRNIYLGMATIYGEKYQVPINPLVAALRDELYPQGYERIDFRKARDELRDEDLYQRPGRMLRCAYAILRFLERTHSARRRGATLADLREHIRYELRVTSHTNLSPVSGLLNLIALWIADSADADVKEGFANFEGWIWEDDENGARVAGARSATWDTAFATQALVAALPHVDVGPELGRADRFLESQQIRQSSGREQEFFRANPEGGYCFAGVWHGWPVSDCTAEAVIARLGVRQPTATEDEMTAAARFILGSQNRDGGFGSYEARRVDLPLEWLNPAEMFGDSMTEMSYIECTASCVEALMRFHHVYPSIFSDSIAAAVQRAGAWMRSRQRPDGAWDGNWGIHLVYGTLFGVRGLLASGAVVQDPAIRRACEWLRARQRSDGGWAEDHKSAVTGSYIEGRTSQTVQTSWALMALLAAHDPDWDCIERGAQLLAATQNASGRWEKQDPEGIFFHTALLDYTLYRAYFPLWALALYETRRLERVSALRGAKSGTEPPWAATAKTDRGYETPEIQPLAERRAHN